MVTKASCGVKEQLKEFDEDYLLRYFYTRAGYIPDAPIDQGRSYAIRVGSFTLFSDCTEDLFEQFVSYIKTRKPKLKHQWVRDRCRCCGKRLAYRKDGKPNMKVLDSICKTRVKEWEEKYDTR